MRALLMAGLLLAACAGAPEVARPEPRQEVRTLPTSPVAIEDVHYPGEVVVLVFSFPFPVTLRPAEHRDCDAEHHACYQDCKRTPPPWPLILGSTGHVRYCSSRCLAAYMECLAAEAATYSFHGMAAAAAWLYAHPQIAAGAVLIAGGVAFAISTEGASLMLIPKGAQMVR